MTKTDVQIERDVIYAKADGYWTSAPVGVKGTVRRLIPKSFRKRPLELRMDIYKPARETSGKRPLLIMLHGGSFYIGNKEEAGQAGWCEYFASTGYVAASVDYRLGFLPFKCSVRKAERRALEDADSALEYLLSREDLCIDPDRVFAAGTSAGAMISLEMAFRPQDPRRARIRAVGNFWGSVSDLKVLDYADTPILSFQSENDPIMPYSKGYPFQSRLGCFSFLMGLFSNKMYGTYAIYQKALEKGIVCEHHACPETGHRLHMEKDGQFTPRFYEMRDAMAAFFGKC
ncbi:MAG: alpha/beta hydrolase [Bacteroidales bacterium]|nr:alpha/beta hydrolase [Bacteroidales bacterium]